jgi:hypothetical protein
MGLADKIHEPCAVKRCSPFQTLRITRLNRKEDHSTIPLRLSNPHPIPGAKQPQKIPLRKLPRSILPAGMSGSCHSRSFSVNHMSVHVWSRNYDYEDGDKAAIWGSFGCKSIRMTPGSDGEWCYSLGEGRNWLGE